MIRQIGSGRHRALHVLHTRSDEQFFAEHPDRKARIRRAYDQECEGEFWSLGAHDRNRRRIIMWRVPPDNPHYDPVKQPLLKIPFLAFADETILDDDATLLPILDEIMWSNAS